ncbi:endonuclease domain-containing protein [Ureibacillus chungkukjangi]|uniref:endonuclease domain-containing protein n=1 Tax=Ureibacillus chungkukjangi TaxID=1202712 RepID=UPI00203F1A95|nr:endonuclease domain-containing protein [Ureibacillus chungkukjangi]
MKKSPEQIEKMRIATAKRIANGEIPTTSTSINNLIKELLIKLEIEFNEEKQFKYYATDFYLPTFNKVIEVMGDYWHANPNKYPNYSNLNNIQKKDIVRDKRKRTYLSKYYNIDILYVWENEVNNEIKLCEELIKLFVQENKLINYNSFNYFLNSKQGIELKEITVIPYFDLYFSEPR